MGNRVCIIIPTYNNEGTLRQVITEVLKICPDLLVVNDGSTDSTESILESFSGLNVISYPKNKGKGYALRKGFVRAHALGYEYAVTLDSDGQHEPENIQDLTEQIQLLETETVLMGSRNMEQDGIPKKSSFGNKFSNFWVWFNTGIKLSDTQTGFRAYPLRPISRLKWFSNKFEFEVEVLVRLAWEGVEIKEVPVHVNYPEDRVSHFRPFHDFARISVLNTVFFFLTLGYFAPKRLFFVKGDSNIFTQIRREFKRHQHDPMQMAGSVGLGLFFGVFPIWGFQMIVAFFAASLLKMNRVIVLTFSNISLPPFIPMIIISSYFFGSFFVEKKVLIPDFSEITVDTIYLQLYQYMVGAVILSCVLGALGFGITYILMKVKSLYNK
ncbi:DUF2062 domain-containing protein [Algoriphagus aquimarinus]|uniref:Glycosyltransferase involved in cell wall bisynthesis n=1 Tax=Algoriphagus aquimarinus TaxID=237018 RepID=A0A1I0XZH9_9BACT|nr:DUF2062 domain-containing protein [Algoriphagus aquimarinus]SFB06451.1 Glycosyltransferase involved in cell wall bisynthesis [Algoriphagus aquimarinus]